MKNVLIAYLFLFLVGCSSEGLPPGDRAGGIKFSKESEREKVISMFEEKEIPYEFDDRGFVNYLLKDQAQVLGIVRNVKYGERLSPTYFESEILPNEDIKKLYIEEFKKASIPYQLDTHSGDQHIFWRQTYGPQVDLIRQKINMEVRRLSRIEAVEEGRAPENLVDDLEK